MTSQFYENLRYNLDHRFHNSHKFAGRMSLAVLSRTPILFHGLGGLGKSEMIQVALKTMGFPYKTIECHPEITVADLFGGAVALTEHFEGDGSTTAREITRAATAYDKGFLNYEVIFLEEMADMPVRTMAALKSVLTSGEWEGQSSKNLITIGATNTSLKELEADMQPSFLRSFRAFCTRFIEIEHSWDDFDSSQYYGVLQAYEGVETAPEIRVTSPQTILEEMELVKQVRIPDEIKHVLSDIFAKVTADGRVFLGGRDIIYCLRLAQTYAYMHGADEVDISHLSVIELFGAGDEVDDLEEIVAESRRTQDAKDAISALKLKRATVLEYYDKAGVQPYLKALTVRKNLESLLEKTTEIVTTDSTHTTLEILKERLAEDIDTAQEKIEEYATTEVLI